MSSSPPSLPTPVPFEWSKLCVALSGSIELNSQADSAVLWFRENFFTAPIQGFYLGEFSISARRALLLLPLTNARMPLDKRTGIAALEANKQVTYTRKTTESATSEKAGFNKVSGGLTEHGPTLSLEGRQAKTGQELATETTTSGTDVLPSYAVGGSAEQPTWQYEARGANPILVGSLNKRILGEIDVGQLPFAIRFQVKLRARDAHFSGLSGLLPETIAKNPNKLSITKILIWRWLNSQVEPFLIDEAVEVSR